MISEVVNMDCMEYMKQFPDNFFDLAVVDPPYGIHMDGGKIGGEKKAKVTEYTKKIGISHHLRQPTFKSYAG